MYLHIIYILTYIKISYQYLLIHSEYIVPVAQLSPNGGGGGAVFGGFLITDSFQNAPVLLQHHGGVLYTNSHKHNTQDIIFGCK